MSKLLKFVRSEYGLVQVDVVMCDTCGKMSVLQGLVGWIHTAGLGADVTTFTDKRNEGDFCSRKCVVEYFTPLAVKLSDKDTLRAPIR